MIIFPYFSFPVLTSSKEFVTLIERQYPQKIFDENIQPSGDRLVVEQSKQLSRQAKINFKFL